MLRFYFSADGSFNTFKEKIEEYINKIIAEFEEFKNLSLKGSLNASKREALTSHVKEHIVDGQKATFCIENYLVRRSLFFNA